MLIHIAGKSGTVCSCMWVTATVTVRTTYKLKGITYKLLSFVAVGGLNGFFLDLFYLACFCFLYLCISGNWKLTFCIIYTDLHPAISKVF